MNLLINKLAKIYKTLIFDITYQCQHLQLLFFFLFVSYGCVSVSFIYSFASSIYLDSLFNYFCFIFSKIICAISVNTSFTLSPVFALASKNYKLWFSASSFPLSFEMILSSKSVLFATSTLHISNSAYCSIYSSHLVMFSKEFSSVQS